MNIPHRRRNAFLALWIAAASLSLSAPAWAVVPGLAGPLQSLGQLLPQLLPFVGVGLAGLLSSRPWRERIAGWGQRVGAKGWMVAAVMAVALATRWFLIVAPIQGSAEAAPVSAPVAGADWPMFRGDLARLGAAPGSAGPADAAVAWSLRDSEASDADFSSSPAVVGDRVYVGSGQSSMFSTGGMVYCLDARSGSVVWRFRTDNPVFSSPAVVDGRVYVGEGLHQDRECNLYCLDAATGTKLWATTTRSHTESSPAVVDGRVYFGAGDDGVYCLAAATGEVLWHRDGFHVDASPAVASGRVFLGSGYGNLVAMALDATTGEVLWSRDAEIPVWGPPAVSGDRVYFGLGNGDFAKSAARPRGEVWCVEAATGKSIWQAALGDAVLAAVVVAGDRAYAGCRDGNLYALDAANGEVAWAAPCGGPVVSSPAADGRRFYVAGSTGQLHCLNQSDGQIAWSLDLGRRNDEPASIYGSPALAAGRLFVGTSGGEVVCVGK